MIVEYYPDPENFEMITRSFIIDPDYDKPYWAAWSWWLVPGTFSYD